MKNDLFTIGPFTIHGYGLMIGIGILVCLIVGLYRGEKKGMNQEAIVDIGLLSMISGFLGAKLLYVIVEFDAFLSNPLEVLGSEGFVVYGGIVLGIVCAALYCHRKKLVFLKYLDLLAPSISIAQGFGRIGCFLAGCCYGKETTSSIGVVFPEGNFAPSGVKLLPTQLFSSAGNFLIATVLLLYSKHSKKEGDVGSLYLFLYGIGRFLIEFLRSDDRGNVGFLSTSQFISIGIVLSAFLLHFRHKLFPTHKNKNINHSFLND